MNIRTTQRNVNFQRINLENININAFGSTKKFVLLSVWIFYLEEMEVK